jgi:hypothetical protein
VLLIPIAAIVFQREKARDIGVDYEYSFTIIDGLAEINYGCSAR